MCCNEKRINLTYPGHDYFFSNSIRFDRRDKERQWKNTLRDLFYFKNQKKFKILWFAQIGIVYYSPILIMYGVWFFLFSSFFS